MKIYLPILLLSAFLITGCTQEKEKEVEAPKTEASTEQTKEQSKEVVEETTVDENFVKEQTKLLEIVKTVKIGATKEEVAKVIGDKFSKIESTDGIPLWRYDLGASSDYQFDTKIDQVDVEALAQKKVQVIAFIEWDKNEKVQAVNGIYEHQKENQIYEYVLKSDGTIVHEAINLF